MRKPLKPSQRIRSWVPNQEMLPTRRESAPPPTNSSKPLTPATPKPLATQWSTDAKYTDESGRQFIGRDAIEKEYASLFKEHPGATITVNIDSIRFLGPDIALETGVAKVQLPKSSAATASHYNVVHARRDGKWVIVVGHDTPYVSSLDEDYLKDLEWTIGKWNAGTKDKEVHINFEWMAGRNFIKNTYMLVKDGKSTLTGGQIIGWDPLLGSIVSWHFDALGGFGHDVWTREGSKWVIHAAGIMRDASDSSAVNIITPIDANSFTWQSTKRTLDGVSLPDVPPVKIVPQRTKSNFVYQNRRGLSPILRSPRSKMGLSPLLRRF